MRVCPICGGWGKVASNSCPSDSCPSNSLPPPTHAAPLLQRSPRYTFLLDQRDQPAAPTQVTACASLLLRSSFSSTITRLKLIGTALLPCPCGPAITSRPGCQAQEKGPTPALAALPRDPHACTKRSSLIAHKRRRGGRCVPAQSWLAWRPGQAACDLPSSRSMCSCWSLWPASSTSA